MSKQSFTVKMLTEDIALALNKMCLVEMLPKNRIVNNALRDYLKSRGFLDSESKYIAK